jgi:hypothetical protein
MASDFEINLLRLYLQSVLKIRSNGYNAGVAQLVERHLAKVEVAGSSLVSRSQK